MSDPENADNTNFLYSDKLAFDVSEVAKTTGLSTRYVRELMATGELKSIKIGKRRLINRQQLLEFLQFRL